jgi:hypothetical protein
MVELVMRFEEDLGIAIPDEVAATLETPRHVIDHAAERLVGTADAGGETWTRERIAAVVRNAVLDDTGLEPRKYHEDARFVQDMGLD